MTVPQAEEDKAPQSQWHAICWTNAARTCISFVLNHPLRLGHRASEHREVARQHSRLRQQRPMVNSQIPVAVLHLSPP